MKSVCIRLEKSPVSGLFHWSIYFSDQNGWPERQVPHSATPCCLESAIHDAAIHVQILARELALKEVAL